MASTEIVMGRTVVEMQIIKPDQPLGVVVRQGGVGGLTTAGAGATTTHAGERTAPTPT